MSGPAAGNTRALLRTLRSRRRSARRGPIVGAAVVALGAGLFAGPDVITPTQVGVVTHWGGWALETAFVGAVLVACVVTFRVVELLFRAEDAHALRTLPLHGGAVAIDRLRRASAGSTVGLLVVGAFLAPTCLASPAEFGLVTAGYLAVASLLVPVVGYGLIVSALVGVVDPTSLAARLTGGTIGGRGAVHHLAPGLAFGAVASLLLLLKLGAEEPLRVWVESGQLGMTNAAWLGVGLPLVLAAGTVAVGLSGFAKNFHEVQAALYDAEVPPPDTGYEYFRNDTRADWVERRVPPLVAVLYRKDRLQMTRGAPFLFPSTILVAVIAAFILWASGDGVVAAGGAGAALGMWLVVVIAPARRLRRLPGEERYGLADMLSPSSAREVARRLAGARLTVRHATPLLVCSVAAGTDGGAVAVGVLSAAAATICGLGAEREEATWIGFAALAAVGLFAARSPSPVVVWTAIGAVSALAVGYYFARVLRPARQLSVPR